MSQGILFSDGLGHHPPPHQTHGKTHGSSPTTTPPSHYPAIPMPTPTNPSQEDIEEPITTAPPEVERIIREVIRLEKANLSSDRPRIRADVLKIIKDTVK